MTPGLILDMGEYRMGECHTFGHAVILIVAETRNTESIKTIAIAPFDLCRLVRFQNFASYLALPSHMTSNSLQ